MLEKFSLQSKLRGLCLLLSFFTVMSGSLAFWSLQRVSGHYRHVAHTNLPRTTASLNLLSQYRKTRIGLMKLAWHGLTAADVAAAKEESAKGFEGVEEAVEAYLEGDYEPGVKYGPKEKELFETVRVSWKAYEERRERVLEAFDDGRAEEVQSILLHEDAQASEVMTAAIDRLIEYSENDAQKAVVSAEVTASDSNKMMGGIVVISLMCGLGIGYLLANSISKQLHLIADTLASDANQLSATSNDVATASQRLSESTTEQAAALQETTASLEETSAMIGKNADNARRSTTVSKSSQDSAQQGRAAVVRMIHSIGEISESNDRIMTQIEQSNREIGDIVKVIGDIGNKTKVINDIVFQTKLLSFNASVEAARAGEHGKGFAVVAEEVGNLAQMSGNAAKEITEMLASSISTVERIAKNTESSVGALIVEGKAKVSAGTTTAEDCGAMLEKIVAEVSDVSLMVADISTASQEQSRGVEEINKAMAQLDQASQQNNSITQTVSHSAEQLNHDVAELRLMVTRLNDMLGGKKTKEGSGSPHPKKTRAAEAAPLSSHSASKSGSNVFALPSATASSSTAESQSVPSRDDARFKDV